MKKSNMGNLTPVTSAIIGMTSQEVLASVLRRIIDNTALDVNVLNEMLLGIHKEPKLVKAYTDDEGVEYRLVNFNPFTFEVTAEYNKEVIRYHDSETSARDAEIRGNEYAGFENRTDKYRFESRVKVPRRRSFFRSWPTEE